MLSKLVLAKVSQNLRSNNRSFVAAGRHFFRLNDNGKQFCPEDLPTNMENFNQAEQAASIIIDDRSREMSGQQTSRLFASGFMAGQESLSEIGQDTIDTHGYDMVGNAHMASVVQSHVPEPFSAVDEGNNLKEGLPEGLSEMGGLQRWTMEDRMEHSQCYHNQNN